MPQIGTTKVVDGNGNTQDIPVYNPSDIQNNMLRVVLDDGKIGVLRAVPAGQGDVPVRFVDGNGNILELSKSSPALDNFEDGDIDEYSGNKKDGGRLVFDIESDLVKEGNYSLKANGLSKGGVSPGGGDSTLITRTDKIVKQGEQIRGWVYEKKGTLYSEYSGIAYGVQNATGLSDASCYIARMSASENKLSWQKLKNGSIQDWASNSANVPAFEWFQLDIKWKKNGEQVIKLLNQYEDILATLVLNDTQYTSGGFGFYQGGGDPVYFDNLRRI